MFLLIVCLRRSIELVSCLHLSGWQPLNQVQIKDPRTNAPGSLNILQRPCCSLVHRTKDQALPSSLRSALKAIYEQIRISLHRRVKRSRKAWIYSWDPEVKQTYFLNRNSGEHKVLQLLCELIIVVCRRLNLSSGFKQISQQCDSFLRLRDVH